MFKELFEKTEDQVYFQGDTLWAAYGEGSGTTSYNLDIKKYLNSDSSDTDHYDDIVQKILRYSKQAKPLKSKNNVKLFEISKYPESRYAEFGKKLDIWGGDIKPQKKYYMIVTEEKSTIVNFFDKKYEALNWIKSIS
ncbi:MAG: hypothetical protein J7L15_04460 [Clostridiales bacterium]|nr:hypothetical protein [Clostridiales bacterium]